MSYRLIGLVLLLSISLLACEEGGSNQCSIKNQNRFVHELLLDKYLWYDEVPASINYVDFDSPQQTLDFLRFDTYDPPSGFSYITDASAFDSLYNAGQYLGYGFGFLKSDSEGRVWVRFIYADSPAGQAGLERGDEILYINGESVTDIINSLAWDGIFGPATEGHPLSLMVRKADTSIVPMNMTKSVVNINTVLHHSIINQDQDRIGYLVYKSFLNTSNQEFPAVFADFTAASVNKVILDLRYNGGGSVSVARNLGSYLYADHQANEVFTHLIHNDKNQSENFTYIFRQLTDALELDQVIVIATGETCSASEMIINGLRPFVDVRVVGTTTCGKPVGMNKYEFCDNAILPVTFASYNQLFEGGYFNGLTANCAANDDVSYRFGETTEPMLEQALNLSQNNQCLSARASAAFSEDTKPDYSAGSLRAIIGAI